MSRKTDQRNTLVHLRAIVCPECSHVSDLLCARLPNYCIECGRPILAKIRADPEQYVKVSDPGASIRYDAKKNLDRDIIQGLKKAGIK